MTLGELIESGLVKDNHKICVNMQIGTTKRWIAGGHWFQDQILDYLNWKIRSMEFEYGYLWTVNVTAGDDEEEETE